jgi:hypothetical protein
VSGAYWQTPNNVNNGHPPDKYGWAAAVGALINMDFISRGDKFGIQATVGEGATGFVTNSNQWSMWNNSNRIGVAWSSDAVFTTGTTVELTRAWNINAGYEHLWNEKWRTTWYGGYVKVDYNANATNRINAALPAGNACGAAGFGGVVTTGNFTGITPLAGNSCNPDYSFAQVGTRTLWNPVRNLDIGLDLLYTKLNSAYAGPANFVASGARPACLNPLPGNGGCAIEDQNVWSAMFRWQRNFYP